MEGFIFFLFSLVFLGFVGLAVWFLYWSTFTIKGQRFVAKSARKQHFKRGEREAEVFDGLDEEIIRERVEKEMQKQARQNRRQA